MPGNIAIHPGINPQQIQVNVWNIKIINVDSVRQTIIFLFFQVIAAGKAFPGSQLAPHMLTTAQGKQVLQAGQTCK